MLRGKRTRLRSRLAASSRPGPQRPHAPGSSPRPARTFSSHEVKRNHAVWTQRYTEKLPAPAEDAPKDPPSDPPGDPPGDPPNDPPSDPPSDPPNDPAEGAPKDQDDTAWSAVEEAPPSPGLWSQCSCCSSDNDAVDYDACDILGPPPNQINEAFAPQIRVDGQSKRITHAPQRSRKESTARRKEVKKNLPHASKKSKKAHARL